MSRRAQASINGLFLLATLIVNALGAFGLINGLSQKEISDMYITLITPSPSTFSISASLVKLQWNGFGLPSETWAIIMLIIAVVLVFAVNLKVRNAVFPLPLAWAFFGIFQFLQSPNGFKGQYANLQTVSLIGTAVLAALALLVFIQNRFTVFPSKADK